MKDINDLIRLVKLTHQVQQVKRRCYVVGESEHENDAEHMYQLALATWYLIDGGQSGLNKDLAIKYSLVHDLVEAYAGDQYEITSSVDERALQKNRERDALVRLAEEFPDFEGIASLVGAYESQADLESQFVYALDKVLPVINTFLDGGRDWKEDGVTLQMTLDNKMPKLASSPQVKAYFEQLVVLLKNEEKTLFPS